MHLIINLIKGTGRESDCGAIADAAH